MTIASLAEPQSRCYEAYATQDADCDGEEAAALFFRRDIRPLPPPPAAEPVTFAARKAAATAKPRES